VSSNIAGFTDSVNGFSGKIWLLDADFIKTSGPAIRADG